MIIIVRELSLKKIKAKKKKREAKRKKEKKKEKKKINEKGAMLLSLFPHLCFKVAPCPSYSESHILCFKVAPCSSYRESLELSLSYTSGNFSL